MKSDNPTSPTTSNHSMLLKCFILIALPYYLNDFANIFIKDWRVWWAIDFTCVKLFQGCVVAWLLWRKYARPADFGLTAQRALPFAAVAVASLLIATVIDQNALPFLKKFLHAKSIGGMPAITNPTWNWIDLTLGLALVGVFEELVFRAWMHTVLVRYTKSAFVIALVSSAAFGLIHWSAGPHAVINAAIIGAVFMLFYLRTRSAPALMLAHFMVDFIAYAGVIPAKWFIFYRP